MVGKKLGESSRFFRMSLHLLTVSKSRKVSPTEKSVAKQLAISLRVGGPGALWMCVVNCSTNFFWHPFMSAFWAATRTLSKNRSHSKRNTGFLWSAICLYASSFNVKLCDSSMVKHVSLIVDERGDDDDDDDSDGGGPNLL